MNIHAFTTKLDGVRNINKSIMYTGPDTLCTCKGRSSVGTGIFNTFIVNGVFNYNDGKGDVLNFPNAEKFNSVSWEISNTITNNITHDSAEAGTTNAAILIGGAALRDPNASLDSSGPYLTSGAVEIFNGISWSENSSASFIYSIRNARLAGNANSAWLYGGEYIDNHSCDIMGNWDGETLNSDSGYSLPKKIKNIGFKGGYNSSQIVISGGLVDNTSTESNNTWVFNSSTHTWTTKSNCIIAQDVGNGNSTESSCIMYGRQTNSSLHICGQTYNIISDSWSIIQNSLIGLYSPTFTGFPSSSNGHCAVMTNSAASGHPSNHSYFLGYPKIAYKDEELATIEFPKGTKFIPNGDENLACFVVDDRLLLDKSRMNIFGAACGTQKLSMVVIDGQCYELSEMGVSSDRRGRLNISYGITLVGTSDYAMLIGGTNNHVWLSTDQNNIYGVAVRSGNTVSMEVKATLPTGTICHGSCGNTNNLNVVCAIETIDNRDSSLLDIKFSESDIVYKFDGLTVSSCPNAPIKEFHPGVIGTPINYLIYGGRNGNTIVYNENIGTYTVTGYGSAPSYDQGIGASFSGFLSGNGLFRAMVAGGIREGVTSYYSFIMNELFVWRTSVNLNIPASDQTSSGNLLDGAISIGGRFSSSTTNNLSLTTIEKLVTF